MVPYMTWFLFYFINMRGLMVVQRIEKTNFFTHSDMIYVSSKYYSKAFGDYNKFMLMENGKPSLYRLDDLITDDIIDERTIKKFSKELYLALEYVDNIQNDEIYDRFKTDAELVKLLLHNYSEQLKEKNKVVVDDVISIGSVLFELDKLKILRIFGDVHINTQVLINLGVNQRDFYNSNIDKYANVAKKAKLSSSRISSIYSVKDLYREGLIMVEAISRIKYLSSLKSCNIFDDVDIQSRVYRNNEHAVYIIKGEIYIKFANLKIESVVDTYSLRLKPIYKLSDTKSVIGEKLHNKYRDMSIKENITITRGLDKEMLDYISILEEDNSKLLKDSKDKDKIIDKLENHLTKRSIEAIGLKKEIEKLKNDNESFLNF